MNTTTKCLLTSRLNGNAERQVLKRERSLPGSLSNLNEDENKEEKQQSTAVTSNNSWFNKSFKPKSVKSSTKKPATSDYLVKQETISESIEKLNDSSKLNLGN
jgi:hypothetical protein